MFVKMDYDKVMALPVPKRIKPKKPNLFWRILLKLLSGGVLKKKALPIRWRAWKRWGISPA